MRCRLDFFHLAVAADGQSLVDKNPQQPAAESSFTFEFRWIAGRCQSTVFHSIFGSVQRLKNTTCNEIKQLVTAREPNSKDG